jgi:hypothetical protein
MHRMKLRVEFARAVVARIDGNKSSIYVRDPCVFERLAGENAHDWLVGCISVILREVNTDHGSDRQKDKEIPLN